MVYCKKCKQSKDEKLFYFNKKRNKTSVPCIDCKKKIRTEKYVFKKIPRIININSEEWALIPFYNENYYASNFGRIKSINYNRTKQEGILKSSINKHGYYIVGLSNGKKTKTFAVHRLVAMAFLNHKPCGHELVVNHINFNKLDNRVENLEIITQRENSNMKHINSTSKYTGVFWDKKSKKWRASITIKCHNIYLGLFDSEHDAHLAYENAVKASLIGEKIQVKHKEFSSKYTGISWHKRDKKWIATFTLNGKRTFLGYFKTEIEAKNARELKLKTIGQ